MTRGSVCSTALCFLFHYNRILINFKFHLPGSFDKLQHMSDILMFLDIQRIRNPFQLKQMGSVVCGNEAIISIGNILKIHSDIMVYMKGAYFMVHDSKIQPI